MPPDMIECSPGEFPRRFLPLLRCSRDAAPLYVASELRATDIGLVDATLVCSRCAHEYSIIDGIVRMLRFEQAPEDEHEIALRDIEYGTALDIQFVPPPGNVWRSAVSDFIEIPSFLAALAPLDGRLILEIGCGDGRFTLLMAQLGAQVLAVDFSLNALTKLAARLPAGVAPTAYNQPPPDSAVNLRPQVGLIQANASQFHASPAQFDRVLSTTPLDSRAQRLALYDSVATALSDEGRFIGSVEYDSLRHRSLGLPVATRYVKGGIFIEYFDVATVRRETAPFFGSVHLCTIRPSLPFLSGLSPGLLVGIARLVERLPGLRQMGEILLFRAMRPLRPPAEGIRRRGWPLFKAIYDWRARRRGQASGGDE
jgi:SAM-dependent methyltransferase